MQHASGVFEVSILDWDFILHLVHKIDSIAYISFFLVTLPIPVINITNDSIFRTFAGGGGHLRLGSGAQGASRPGGHPGLLHRIPHTLCRIRSRELVRSHALALKRSDLIGSRSFWSLNNWTWFNLQHWPHVHQWTLTYSLDFELRMPRWPSLGRAIEFAESGNRPLECRSVLTGKEERSSCFLLTSC